ncbi:hypothetical protein [Streptomyces sp. 7N604]|uniref:hypothetical protein n=1 Tax=Streptomyces sp. 7N604 TaxID=3457415 RepID=UPI003FCEF549
MVADEPQPSQAAADQPDDSIQAAIRWFSLDTAATRQAIPRPDRPQPTGPGTLLADATYDLQFERLLPGEGRERALVDAQATWLIRRLPAGHQPPSLDSAQQAGRAWGVLIAAHTDVLPTQDVLTAVARRTGMSVRAADQIIAQARTTSAAYNRATSLVPYDHAPDEALIADWNRLAACGPELPDAAERAHDLLELLAPRITGADDYTWMNPTARQVAHLYNTIVQAQPMLPSLSRIIPDKGAPNADAGQDRLVEMQQQGALTSATTAAARAQAVLDWANRAGTPNLARTNALEAAGPGMRTILELNRALAALEPAQSRPLELVLAPQRVAQVVEAFDRLVARISEDPHLPSPLPSATHRPGRHPHASERHHQPPAPGPGGGTPRPAP